MGDPGHPSILFGLPALAAAVLAFFFAPRITEAEATNKSILRLLNEGKDSEATAEATAAINAGIPLRPNVAKAIPGIAEFPNISEINSDRPSDTWVVLQLGDGTPVRVLSRTLLYFSAGQWPTNFNFVSPRIPINLVGSGADRAFIIQNNPGGPLMDYKAARMLSLVYGLTFTPKDVSDANQSTFISLADESTGPIVSNVVVKLLNQNLDRIEWIEVEFVGCNVTCSGGWLKLTGVRFNDCRFSFTDGVPEDIKEQLENSQGQRVSLRFRTS